MLIPKSLKIGASRHKVVLKPECWGEKAKYLGEVYSGSQEIWLAKNADGKVLPESSVADTFLHEVIHSVSRTYGLGLRENQVAGLAGGLLQVIRDNKLDFRGGNK